MLKAINHFRLLGVGLELAYNRGFSNAHGVNLLLMIFRRMSLHCKLVPVHYQEYKNGLFAWLMPVASEHTWFKKIASLCQPIGSKTKTNRDSLAHVFTRFESATCIGFEFSLVHWIICVTCDWPE